MLNIVDSTISDNEADRGGGIGSDDASTMTLTSSTVSGNIADGRGGSLVVGGGGIFVREEALLTITDSTISGNSTTRGGEGGGILNSKGTVTISGSTISGNTATTLGGSGGGIEHGSEATLTITNSTISGNSAYGAGGLSSFGPAALRFTTVTDNTSIQAKSDFNNGDTGGIVVYGTSSRAANAQTLRLFASVVVGNKNVSGGTRPDCKMQFTSPIFVSDGYNVVGGADCPAGGPSDVVATNAATVLNSTLASNGGPTQTHALVIGSVAVDRVPTADCTIAAERDQRGSARPVGTACDSGAYEGATVAPSPSPSTSPSPSPSTAPCGQVFGDVPGTSSACQAIEGLAARGVIKGCDQSATPPLFCPADPTLREHMAALIVRAIPEWANETGLPSFTDNTDDTELMTRVATLQRHGVVRGYQDEVCTAQGKTPSCYGPLDDVTYGQTLLFITRAMVIKGYWVLQPDDRSIFPDQNGAAGANPDTDQQTLDHRAVVTYIHYLGNPPDVADVHAPFMRSGVDNGGWADSSSRAWFARAFWPAIKDR